MLKMKNITKQFPGVRALDQVSLEACDGEVLGLIGINGAGKSTLMNILGGVFRCDEGEIEIDGAAQSFASPKEAENAGISFIHQEPVFFCSMTVAENIFMSRLFRSSIPFFTDPLYAKITIICINIWIGVPFTMLSTTGILQNIPQELYEAARVDGAGPIVTFRKITLPYMMFIMMPYLITTFTGNVNNFNVIFLTSQGLPRSVDSTAGKTDLLVTWLYKLTIENQYYNVGAVIGIMTFVTLAVVSLITFKFSASNRNEEAFR